MATPAQRTNTWILDQWYDQAVAGTQGEYTGEGQLYAVGYGQGGRLGQNVAGPTTRISSPAQIPGTSWITTAQTGACVLSIKSDGTLWAWGKQDDHYPMGLNNDTRYSSPTQVGSDSNWSFISTGVHSQGVVGATKTDGTLWTWGNNEYGTLGDNTDTSRSSPTQIPGTDWNTSIGGIAAGNYGFMALKTDGALYCWGRGPGVPRNSYPISRNMSSPVLIAAGPSAWSVLPNTHYNDWACIRADGTLWSAGGNTYGQLGLNNTTSYSSPKQVGTDTTWAQVGGGDNHMGGIKTNGTLWMWGNTVWGSLGLNQGPGSNISSPTQVGTNTTWHRVSFSYGACMATKTDGSLWTWGNNYQGSRAQNNAAPTGNLSSPTQIGTDTDWNIDNSRSLIGQSISFLTKFG